VRTGSEVGWGGWTSQGKQGRALARGASERISLLGSEECREENVFAN